MSVTDTNFERVRRALLRQGEGDRVPLFELSIHKDIKAEILGHPVSGLQDEVEFWRAAGYDFVSTRAGVRSVVRGFHPAVKEWQRTHQRQEFDQATEGWAMVEKGIIDDRQDFKDFPWPQPEELAGHNDSDTLDEYLTKLANLLPTDMKLLVQLGYIFMGAWQLLGFENFFVKLKTDPELVKDTIDWLGSSQLAVLEVLLQHDCVGVIWLPDDLCFNSGPLMRPKLYEQLIYPWYVRTVERCHQANIPVGLHSDGDLTLLLPGLIDCGFDCIHPFEPPMNDIVAIKRKWGKRIAVAGNIDLKETLCAGRPEDVAAEVREKMATLAPGGGWLLGSSNSIPDFVPIDNYRALLAAGLKYGKYNGEK